MGWSRRYRAPRGGYERPAPGEGATDADRVALAAASMGLQIAPGSFGRLCGLQWMTLSGDITEAGRAALEALER